MTVYTFTPPIRLWTIILNLDLKKKYRCRYYRMHKRDQQENKCGVSRQVVTKWENGNDTPDFYDFNSLPAAFGKRSEVCRIIEEKTVRTIWNK